MAVLFETVWFPAYDEAAFTVRFQMRDSVDNMDVSFFQFTCPLDVVCFVKACLEFNDSGDLLSIQRCFFERLDDRAVAAGSIKGLLYGKYLRVTCSLFDKLDDWSERIVGVM